MSEEPSLTFTRILPPAYLFVAGTLWFVGGIWHVDLADRAFVLISFPAWQLALLVALITNGGMLVVGISAGILGLIQYAIIGRLCDALFGALRARKSLCALRESGADFICNHCNYPVHSTPTNRCPECGKIQSE